MTPYEIVRAQKVTITGNDKGLLTFRVESFTDPKGSGPYQVAFHIVDDWGLCDCLDFKGRRKQTGFWPHFGKKGGCKHSRLCGAMIEACIMADRETYDAIRGAFLEAKGVAA